MADYTREKNVGREVATGAAMSVAVASIDVSLALIAEHANLSSLRYIFPPLGAVAIFVFAVWVASWLAFVGPVCVRLGLSRTASRVAYAFMVGTFVVIADVSRYTDHLLDPFNIGLMGLFAIGAGVGAYHTATRLLRRDSTGIGVGGGMYALPLVLVAAAILQWSAHYASRSVVVASGVFVAALIVLVLLATRSRKTAWPPRVATFLLVALIPMPPIVQALDRRSPPQLAADPSKGVRHVIMIIIDTLRADHVSCYSDKATPTPAIDALAGEGVRFDHAVSASPWTLPAVASIVTAVPPRVHRALEENSVLPSALVTLAERMREAGYLTGAVGHNPVLDPSRGMSDGFWEYDWFPRQTTDTSIGTSILKRIYAEYYRSEASTDVLTDLAIDWIEAHHERPFFFYLHYYDPHAPYAPPEGFRPDGEAPERVGYSWARNRAVRAGTFAPTPEEFAWAQELYRGEIRYVDASVERLLDRLKALGIYDDALIVVTSDHGEEFMEHGNVAHGHSLYEELIRVPLIVKTPGSTTRRVVESTVATQAIAPTILDVCNVEYDERHIASTSFAATLDDGAIPDSVNVYSGALHFYEPRESIVLDRVKYIVWESGKEELYDLRVDPGEKRSLVSDSTQALSRYRALYDAHLERIDRLRESYEIIESSIELDEEATKRLKALGYM